jgi:hypothetical protein
VCTDDTCVIRSCENTPVTDGTTCDDGEFCTVSDTCQEGVCEGTGSPCTASTTCNEETQTCDCAFDADCDDGEFCNGAETCDGTCQDGTPVDCPDDEDFCNGVESCDEDADQCVSSGDPCGEDEICIPESETCEPVEPAPESSIDATFIGCGRAFLPEFGIVTIQGTGTDFGLLSIVRYDSLMVVKVVPRLLNQKTQTMTHLVGQFPSLDPFFPVLLPAYPITVEVTVDGLSDTFIIPACGEEE